MLELKFTNRDYSTVPLNKARITLGSDPGNDVVLQEAGIAEFQLEFFRQDDRVLAVNLVGHSCTKNGQPLNGSEPLQMGDLLNLESIEMEVVDPFMATEKFDASDLRSRDRQPEAGVDEEMAAVFAAANDGASAWSLKGLNDAVSGLRFPLGGKVVIGRDPNCDLVLKTPQVSRRHTEIEVLNSQLFLRDLGSTNGSRVNGQQVSTSMVRPGDKISVDQIEFLVEGPEDDEEATIARHFPKAADDLAGPYLLVRTGSKAGQKIPLTKSRYTLGRNSSNDIVLEDQSVSGRHAVLIKTDGGWKIEDAESTNGTSINGEAVMGGQLHHSDRVRLGSIKLAYIVPSEQALRDSERLESGGFDPNATVQTHAIQRPKEWGNLYWIGGGVAALLLVVVIYMLLPSGNNELPALAPITEPLSASPLWERQLPSGRSYPTAPLLADVNGDGYLDTVTADGGGHLLVLDGEEGKMIFDLPFAGRVVGSAVAGDLTGDGIDDLIVASFEGVISAVNGKAQLLWKTGAGSGYGAIYTRPEIADLDGNGVPEIVIATGNKGLVALDSTNGQELWNSAALGLVGVREIPLVVDLNGDGSLELVATTDAGVVWALAANIQSAAVHWQRELPEGALSAPVLAASEEGPLVVVASSTSGVYALFANSGLISWRHSAQTESTMTPIVTADAAGAQRLLVTADSGQVMALSVEGGELLWRQETGDRVVANGASIDLSNDQLPDLVLVGQSGLLSVLDMDDGQLLLTTRINQESAVLVSPVIGDINNDQLAEIVVASQQGSISALTLNRTLTAGSAPWAKNLHRRSIIASE